VTPVKRWRIAIPLVVLSALPFAATLLGSWVYWDQDSNGRRALTVFLAVMFALCVGISVSIGVDRRIRDVPWLRIGAVALLILLACGVSWVRDSF